MISSKQNNRRNLQTHKKTKTHKRRGRPAFKQKETRSIISITTIVERKTGVENNQRAPPPLCSAMSPFSKREMRGVRSLSPQCSPGAFWHRATNRYGDFVWSRGETRDLSKAESSGLLSHVHPPLRGSAKVTTISFVDSQGGEHKYKKTSNGLFV